MTLTILLLLCVWATQATAQVNKRYFVWVGRDMVMDNRYKEAIQTLNILLRADPDAYEGYFWRGIAKYSLDDLLGAEQDFTATLSKNPVYTAAYHFRGLTRSRMGNYEDALADFAEAIELRPDYPAPYYSRGVTNILTQRYDAAVDDFNRYIRFNTRDADAYANRGVAYLHLKDTVSAEADFRRAISANSGYPRGYMERGALCMARGDYDAALADFDAAASCDTAYVPAYFNRAMAHYRKNNLKGALADFDRVLQLDPYSSVTYFNRALLRTETGDYNRALEDYDRVADLSPDNVIVYYNRAGLYLQLGELERALADYDRAIELYPDFANAYLRRASVRYLLRDSRGAERDRTIAQRKIAEYRSRLEGDSEVSFADTSRRFNQLLSFDTRLANSSVRGAADGEERKITLLPLYRFTMREPQKAVIPGGAGMNPMVREFVESVADDRIEFTTLNTDVEPSRLVAMDEEIAASIADKGQGWPLYFLRGVVQSLLRQYTNAVGALSAAIDMEPCNPWLYLQRSAVQAEMTDFISSMEGQYSRISLEHDTHSQTRAAASRTYNYDESIADLNKAVKLSPDIPQLYYNRGNLHALSGNFPEAFADYTRALTLDPLLAEAYFNRGLVQIYMRDTRKGLLDVSKAGELGVGEAYTVLKLYSSEMEASTRTTDNQ